MTKSTRLLTPAEAQKAAEILARGGLVAFPTETVYGLGANGLDPGAVRAIFEAKGRPQDNPLILHVPEEGWLERYCQDIPQSAHALARCFWPGPLTMILKRKPIVPDVVTAGLDTVGMRCPDHPVARRVIELCQLPIAAPSANTSGRPSPTTAQAVWEDMAGKIDAVVDGGPCAVGVESTIIDLTATPPRLLRPGGITLEELRDVLGEVAVDEAVIRLMSTDEKPRAPGMKYRHYAPKAPVTVIRGAPERTAAYIKAHLESGVGVICFEDYVNLFPGCPVRSLGPQDDLGEQARRLFEALRWFDHAPVTAILAQSPKGDGLGLAVTNRLNKAAGFHIIDLT